MTQSANAAILHEVQAKQPRKLNRKLPLKKFMAEIRESTVHFFKKRYIKVLKKAKHSRVTVPEVKSIALRKRGCPLTLVDVDTKVQAYIEVLRKTGTPAQYH